MNQPRVAIICLTGLAVISACVDGTPADGGGVDASVRDAGSASYCGDPAYFVGPFPPFVFASEPTEDLDIPDGDVLYVATSFSTGTEDYRTLWIDEGEDPSIQFRFTFGRGIASVPGRPWSLLFYIDHRPLTVHTTTLSSDTVPLEWSPDVRRAAVDVRIDREDISPGGHAVSVFYDYPVSSPDGTTRGKTAELAAFTVFHGSHEWADLPLSDGAVRAPRVEDSGENALFRQPHDRRHFIVTGVGPDPDGVFRLTLGLQSDDVRVDECDTVERLALVARLDGLPHPLGPDGALVADVTYSQRALFDVDVTGLPLDGLPHRLEILQLGGLRSAGTHTTPEPGATSPGVLYPRRIGVAYWP